VKLQKHLLDSTILILIPGALSTLLYSVIPINNFEPLSVVSVTASINLITWILIIIAILMSLYFLNNSNFEKLLKVSLYSALIYVTTIKLLIKGLSLKGTPLPDSDIRGDLLALVQLANIAVKNLWSGSGYPPLWPTLIGNVARILDLHVLAIFKPAEFILLAVSPFLIFLIWKLFLKSWMALVITIFQTISTNYNYKNLVLNILIPFIIFTLISSYNQTNIILKTRIKYTTFGLFIGFISLMYFGYLYWLTPFFSILIILAFFSQKRNVFAELIILIFLGIGLAVVPIIYSLVEVKLSYLYFMMLGMTLFIFSNHNIKIRNGLNYVGNIGILYVLLKILISYRAHDAWFEGGVGQSNPSLSPIISLSSYYLIIAGLLLYLIYKFIDKKYLLYLLIVMFIYLSATIFMYLIASQMQVSKMVDLWPRAIEVQNYALSITFILITIFIIENVFVRINLAEEYKNKSFEIQFIIIFSWIIIGSFFASTLGNQTYESMPINTFNGAWYAHQGCSNPHRDPMLAKVFENYPDIQKFLRSKCTTAKWPEIPSVKK
jgi:hypothetical protein